MKRHRSEHCSDMEQALPVRGYGAGQVKAHLIDDGLAIEGRDGRPAPSPEPGPVSA